MKLYIDNREPKSIINYINYLNENSKNKFIIEIKTLDLGDYIIYDERYDKQIIIFERKSLSDLESSIKDGRYTEQSFRLSKNDMHNHNIIYLIEGSIINYKNKAFKSVLYSTLCSLHFFKGFSLLNSLNNIETAEIIYRFVNKIAKDSNKRGYYCTKELQFSESYNRENNIFNMTTNVSDNFINDISYNSLLNNNEKPNNKESESSYVNNIKTTKKSNITKENIDIIMLMQIPGVSNQSAMAVLDEYKTIKNLVTNLEKNGDSLNNIVLKSSNRKISKNVIESIKKYLL